MCILVENAEEVAYLTAQGHWTKEPRAGSCFASTRAAFAAAMEEPIGKFNIVQFFTLNSQIINLDHGSGRRKEDRPLQPKSQLQAAAGIDKQEPTPAITA